MSCWHLCAPNALQMQIREAAGIVETNEMRRHDKARERLADQYDKADMRVRAC